MNNNANIALFIDYENIIHNDDRVDVSVVIKELKSRGRLIYKRAYGDWARFYKKRKSLQKHSIDLVEVTSNPVFKKNSADIKLVVDAVETAITKDHINTIVIFSGDSDFRSLISKLREYNKYVIVIGKDTRTTSSSLRGYCDELLYYSNLIEKEAVPIEIINRGFELMIKTIKTFSISEIYSYSIKKKMIELDHTFNEKKIGFNHFNSFLEAAELKGIVKLKDNRKGHYLVSSLLSEEGTTTEQIRLKEKENQGNKKLLKILDNLYWSISILDPSLRKPVSIDEISKNLRGFIPNFSIVNYGIPRNKGFKFLLGEIQRIGYIRLSYDGKKDYVKARQDLIQYGKKLEKPVEFNQVLTERCNKIYKLFYKLSDLVEGQVILESTLVLLEKTEITLGELFQRYLESIKEINAKIPVRQTFYTLLQTSNLIKERGREAFYLNEKHHLNTASFIKLDEEEYNVFFEDRLKEIAVKENTDYNILLDFYRKANNLHPEDDDKIIKKQEDFPNLAE